MHHECYINNFQRPISTMKNKGIGGVSGRLVGFMVAIIIGVGVTIPLTLEVIDDANLTGVTATVVSQIPTILGVAMFVIAASIMD